MTLGETLKAERKKKNISSREAAKQMGMNHSSLQNYEKGTRKPSLENARRLESFYGIKIDKRDADREVKKNTLCWDCKKAVGGCSWSRNFTPVEGWEAEKKKIYCSKKETPIESYLVINCPLFEIG